jgi:hypothetical protein
MNMELDEYPEPKRVREFNDLYDASPKRKLQPRATVESIENAETDDMDLS